MGDKYNVQELKARIEKLEDELDKHLDRWALLWIHPECAKLVAQEMYLGVELEWDRYGHPIGVKK